jgi:hypothetical protein
VLRTVSQPLALALPLVPDLVVEEASVHGIEPGWLDLTDSGLPNLVGFGELTPLYVLTRLTLRLVLVMSPVSLAQSGVDKFSDGTQAVLQGCVLLTHAVDLHVFLAAAYT